MADVFIFPSLYEGFGIPILEGQKCGIPVVASNISAIPEIGGKGALYVDPYSIEDISNKLQQIITDNDLRERLIREGYKNIERFSWEESSKKVNKIIESIGKNL